ncbi:MAG TPA: VWA domain-containing protein [Thermoanaerobaculia bacterium]|nr:VWA domain-containing protein [Thermoanaerobaculia bacterium]
MRNAILGMLFVGALSAQAQFFSEVVEVRVTNVDVVVTDKAGKPVHGLKADDFLLFENGEQKEISNFLEVHEAPEAEVTATATPADDATVAPLPDTRQRQISVFIDDAVLHPLRRNQILTQLGKFLESNMRNGDEVMIAAWGNSLKVELEPTRDRSKIAEAVQHLAARTSAFNEEAHEKEKFHRQLVDLINIYAARQPPEKPPLTLGIYEARTFGMLVTHRMHQRVEALKSVVASMRGAPGRKVLVFVTQNFTSNPAEEAFRYVDATREQFAADGSNAMEQVRQFEIPSLITEIADAANSSGITLYAIDGSGKEGSMSSTDASELVRLAPSGATVGGWSQPTLGAIAQQTGGVALVGSSNWEYAFNTISNDLASYYSLGYRSTGERQDALRAVEVKLKKKGYKLRTRRAVIEPSVGQEMNDAVAAYLFREPGRNDLAIRAIAGRRATTSGEAGAVIPVTVTIPTEKLTLLPDGEDLTGSFSLFAAFVRMDGAVSKVSKQTQSFRFPKESLARRKEITVKLDVTADMRTDGVSIGVMDEASRATGFAAVKVQ